MQNGCARRAVAPSDNNITRGGGECNNGRREYGGQRGRVWDLVVVRGNRVGTFRETSAIRGTGPRG